MTCDKDETKKEVRFLRNRLYLRVLLTGLMLFVIGSPQASAANWQTAVEVEQGALYVDIDSVRKNPGNMIFLNDDRFTSGRAAGRKMTCLTEVAFSLGQMVVRDLLCTHFDKNGRPYATDQAGPWEAVSPDSVMEAAIRVASQYAR